MTKTEKFTKSWSKNRKKGKDWYVLTSSIIMGISIWGGAIIGQLMKGNSLHLDYTYFIGGFIGGIISTPYRWNKNEERYNRVINDMKE